MHDLTAKRTLVKSPPELWSELSEVDRLARHLDAFGEIKITKLEPEHTVAWEGEGASGTVSIEPSGWGTKVTLTAQLDGEAPAPPPEEPAAEAVDRVEEPAVEEPEVEEPAVEEPAVEEAAVEEPAVEDVEQPAIDAVEEPAALEAPAPEAVAPEAVDPIRARRRKRGFLAWLFRPRTSSQMAEEDAPEPVVEVAEPEPGDAGVPEVEETVLEEPLVSAKAAPELDAPAADASEVDAPAADGAELDPPEAVASEAVASEDDSARLDPRDVQAVLDQVLDALGSAHHRPFSRG
jgi:hypothetical protein